MTSNSKNQQSVQTNAKQIIMLLTIARAHASALEKVMTKNSFLFAGLMKTGLSGLPVNRSQPLYMSNISHVSLDTSAAADLAGVGTRAS